RRARDPASPSDPHVRRGSEKPEHRRCHRDASRLGGGPLRVQMLISEEILRAVAQLEIRARRNMTALLAGNYRSAFRGSGMQFKEFRHYEPGDDIRHMSWPVTARTGRATVKVYDEERELDIVLMVDVSG